MTQYRYSTSPLTTYKAHPLFRGGAGGSLLLIVNTLALDGPILTQGELCARTHIGGSGVSRYVKLGVQLGLLEAERSTVTLRPDWQDVVANNGEAQP